MIAIRLSSLLVPPHAPWLSDSRTVSWDPVAHVTTAAANHGAAGADAAWLRLESLPWTVSVSGSGKPGVNIFFVLEMTNLAVCKYFPTSIQIFWSCIRTYIFSGSNKAMHVGAQRLALAGIVAVMCRALETWPGVAALPLERSHGKASSTGRTLFAPTSPWPGCYGFRTLPFWLCLPRSILMDSLTCYLFWGARVSRIITSPCSLPQWTLSEQRYVFVVVANWHPV